MSLLLLLLLLLLALLRLALISTGAICCNGGGLGKSVSTAIGKIPADENRSGEETLYTHTNNLHMYKTIHCFF